jgi:hypothetical protein
LVSWSKNILLVASCNWSFYYWRNKPIYYFIIFKKLKNQKPLALKWEKKFVGTASSLRAVNLEVKVKTVATPNFPSFNPMKLMGGNLL